MTDSHADGRKAQSRARKALFLLVTWVSMFVLLELGWRTHLYAIGKGFFDDPHLESSGRRLGQAPR